MFIPTFGRRLQEDVEFEASSCYTVRSYLEKVGCNSVGENLTHRYKALGPSQHHNKKGFVSNENLPR